MSIDELAKPTKGNSRLSAGIIYTTRQLEEKDIHFKESQQGYAVFEGPRHFYEIIVLGGGEHFVKEVKYKTAE